MGLRRTSARPSTGCVHETRWSGTGRSTVLQAARRHLCYSVGAVVTPSYSRTTRVRHLRPSARRCAWGRAARWRRETAERASDRTGACSFAGFWPARSARTRFHKAGGRLRLTTGERQGNPVQFRNGPAAVRGDAPASHATGPRAGKAAREGAPSQKTSAAGNPNPSRKGGFVSHRFTLAVALAAVVS